MTYTTHHSNLPDEMTAAKFTFDEGSISYSNLNPLRWSMALFLDRDPTICWADIVMWAMGCREDIPQPGSAGLCERLGESPYCGKCNDDS